MFKCWFKGNKSKGDESKRNEPKFGERATRAHLPKKHKEDDFWTKSDLFFLKEKECIEKEIRRRVESEYKNKDPNPNDVWQEIEDVIKTIYVCKVDRSLIDKIMNYIFFVDPVLLDNISNNKNYEKNLKIKSKFLTEVLYKFTNTKLFFIFTCIFLPTLVILIWSYLRWFYFPVIFYVYLILYGGILLGHVIGNQFYIFSIRGELKLIDKILILIKILIGEIELLSEEPNYGLLGLFLILLVTYWWASGYDDIKDILIILLIIISYSLAVVVIAAARKYYINMEKYYAQEQEKRLQVMASKLHRDHLEYYKTYFYNKWNELNCAKRVEEHV